MGHRALIYNVRVHKRYKPKEFVPLGDLDQQGTYLGDVLRDSFANNFVAVGSAKEVICESSNLVGEDLQLALRHGESGYAADIEDAQRQLLLRQQPDHTQLLPCGSLFRLPRKETFGWWAVHVNNNRSVKGLIEVEMVRRFKAMFGDLMLVVTPCVVGSVLAEALGNDQLESVRLFKYDRAADFKDANKWLRKNVHAQIELRISALERKKRLLGQLAKKAAEGDANAYGQIVEFQGLTFDSAKVEVSLDNGSVRTFNLEGPLGGHPFPADIEPTETDGIPDNASLFAELGKVITEMG
jgi:hypothetical protein